MLNVAPDFVAQLSSFGNKPALLFGDHEVVTYAEIAEDIERERAALEYDKSLIAIEARPSRRAVITYLAALASGHAVALLPPGGKPWHLSFKQSFTPDFMFYMDGDDWKLESGADQPRERPHEDLALLLSTSGSTGESKMVRLSYQGIFSNATAIAEYLQLQSSDRGCLVLPFHYSYGLSVLNTHLAAGASLYVPDKSILDTGFLDDFCSMRCTNFSGVPHSYELLESIGFRDFELPELRFMTVAGGRLKPELVRIYDQHLSQHGRSFFVMYGQTEAGPRISYVPPALLPGNEDCIGIAIPGGELSLIDATGSPIAEPDTPGELVYRGPNVMMGYANKRSDTTRGYDLDYLCTGDLAVRNSSGLYRIVGRLKRISKIAGIRIPLDALESTLESEGLTVAVVGDDCGLHAFFCGAQPEDEIAERLAGLSGLTLGHVTATRLPELPRLPTGKLDYANLRNLMLSSRERSAPSEVLQAFREAFYPQKVTPEDSFISLGGDSLRFLHLSLVLERLTGSLPDGWERIPIAQLKPQSEVKSGWTGALPGHVLIRALAILLIVLHHQTHWTIPGGAAVITVLIGYSLGRFQSEALIDGNVGQLFRPALEVFIPYYIILAGYALAWGTIPWASVLLIGNFGFASPPDRTMLPFLYWFVELYGQILLLTGILFSIGWVRKACAEYPFRAALAFFGLTFGALFVFSNMIDIGNREIFTLYWNLYLAALGWCAAFARSLNQRLVVLALGVGVFLLLGVLYAVWMGQTVKYGLLLPTLIVLLFVGQVHLPSILSSLLFLVAASSFYIYLFHRFVPNLLLSGSLGGWEGTTTIDIIAVVGGVSLGIAVFMLQQRARSWLAYQAVEKLK